MIKRLVTVVGARPQFIKSAPVSLALAEAGIEEVMVHTGQHYDPKMSDIFFSQLKLPVPRYNLNIGSGSHAYQTGEGLQGIERVLEQEQPDALLVYGDTNATLAGALAAAKLHLPIAHIEAGLRSFNRRMPEEINRVLTDHVSQWLFTPTQAANQNLANEGITQGVHWVGDVMLDTMNLFLKTAEDHFKADFDAFNLAHGEYFLLTMHRAESTNSPEQVHAILSALDRLGTPVFFPVHPRTRALIGAGGPYRFIRCVEPISYFEMLLVQKHAQLILTDSGGVQKEAAFMQVPCITLRTETEWTETVETGWNQLVGLSPNEMLAAIQRAKRPESTIHHLYGNGEARIRIAHILKEASMPAKPEQVLLKSGV